ncbi:transcription factor of the MADS box [Malassezia brasiliensis]|uniref:Transcription factor of the MADS box n=1 Tax=Malassezia brasiliensis TaxID=1821822 RepID=A0AAF0DWD1_9BASI|nr:transcription factor of the MADS box [Malassezia brasiliensis]
MSNSVPMGSYPPSNVDMNGLLVATCRPDQSGAYPPIYNVPHGTIQLAQGYNALPGGASWPFPMAPVAEPHSSSQPMHGMSSPTTYGPFGGAMPPSTPGAMPPSTPGAQPPMQGSATPSASARATPSAPARGAASGAAPPATPGAAGDAAPRAGKAPAVDDAPDSSESAEGRAGRKRTPAKGEKDNKTGRRKIKIEFIDDDSRRHITFSKRKAGIMKKAYELATLTGTQVLLLVVSQTGLVYTFTTPKLEAIVKQPEGRNLIQECLNAPGPSDEAGPSTQGPPAGDLYTKYEGDEGDEGEEDEEDEEDTSLLHHPDLGLTAQAFTTSPISETAPYGAPPGAPLFHPGWGMPGLAQRAETKQHIKRRRTQPNLAGTGLQQPPAYTSMTMPPMPVERNLSEPLLANGLPMYYAQPLGGGEERAPHLGSAAPVAPELQRPSPRPESASAGHAPPPSS